MDADVPGREMDLGEGEGFECPDCGGDLALGQATCPGCGVGVDWDDLETHEIVDGGVRLMDPRLPPIEEPESEPQLVFSRWGTVFAALTVSAFVSTVLLLRWDTWVQGAPEDSIGDSQRMWIYAGAVATTVLAVLSILDVIRVSSREPVSGELDL